MSRYEKILLLSAVGLLFYERITRKSRRGKKRSLWVKNWLLKKVLKGCYNNLMKELKVEDPRCYRRFVRMDYSSFCHLLELVKPFIEKNDTVMRAAIPAGERLAITLRYLATGQSYASLQCNFRVSAQAIRLIVPETCNAIYQQLKDVYMKVPNSPTEWEKLAESFESRWNFPRCLGALDGKHILMRAPSNSGSYYFNYKHTFSIILLALVDADYRFVYVDVGRNGRASDAGVFEECSLNTALKNETLNLPDPLELHEGEEVPFVIVADDAFPLRANILKPYGGRHIPVEKRIFNYRLSRARRIVENAFGIMASRFRVLSTPMQVNTEVAEKATLACCALHNFLRSQTTANDVYFPPGCVDRELENGKIVDGLWRLDSTNKMHNIGRQSLGRHLDEGKKVRDVFMRYFNSPEGSVPWQTDMV